MSAISPHADRAAWLAARRSTVGGSEVAALFGCQPAYALSAFALWQAKAGRIAEPEVRAERAEWGLRLEAAIAAAAAERLGVEVEPGRWVRHPSVPGMAATTDFHVKDGGSLGHEGPGVMEVKNADWLIHRRTWVGGEPPLHVLLQLQHQLACTGFGWGVVVALIGGNRLAEPYVYKARPALVAEIERRVEGFWQSVERGEPPEPDGAESTIRALARLHPEDDGGREPLDLAADEGLPLACARLLDAQARRRAAELDERAAKALILARMGSARLGRCAGYLIEAAAVAGSPDRVASAGETIRGRAGHRRLNVREADDARS